MEWIKSVVFVRNALRLTWDVVASARVRAHARASTNSIEIDKREIPRKFGGKTQVKH